LAEIEADTRLPPDVVKKAVKSLEKAKLVTEMKTVGDTVVYVPLLAAEVPALSTLRRGADLPMEPIREPPPATKVTEALLRTILKGIEPTAEIVDFQTIYYPVYLIRFVRSVGIVVRSFSTAAPAGNSPFRCPDRSTYPPRRRMRTCVPLRPPGRGA
jgi:hypothetical protein